MLSRRGDLRFVSIDPTLGLNFKSENNQWKISRANREEIEYVKSDSRDPMDKIRHALRVREATEVPGAIVARAPYLPIKDNSVDVVFDAFGPTRFMTNESDFYKYISCVRDILKSGGMGYINFVSESRLNFMRLLPDLQIEVIDSANLKVGGIPEDYYKVKITKK